MPVSLMVILSIAPEHSPEIVTVPPARRELDRVVDNVGEALLQLRAVGVDRRP